MTYSARMIGNAFLKKAEEDKQPLIHRQLQKFIYFAHAWHLAFHGEPLIDEPIKVWPSAPVIESIFHELKSWGSLQVHPMQEMDYENGKLEAFAPNQGDEKVWRIVDQVWEKYSAYTPDQLHQLATNTESPWNQARTQGLRIIADDFLGEHFRKKLSKTAPRP